MEQKFTLRTVLHMAAEKGFIEIVKKLSFFDDLLDKTDEEEETALELAAKSEKEEVVKFLSSEVENKADFLYRINKKKYKSEYIEIFK